eukprot:jgi/Mesvir1/7992/Mv25778-RA.2
MQVYFAVYPALYSGTGKSKESLSTSLQAFRKYLDTCGAEMGREEFLPFYALPYLPDPSKHPSFQALFDPDWVSGQRLRLEMFMASVPRELPRPKLYTMYESYISRPVAMNGASSPPMASGSPQYRSPTRMSVADSDVGDEQVQQFLRAEGPYAANAIDSSLGIGRKGGRAGSPSHGSRSMASDDRLASPPLSTTPPQARKAGMPPLDARKGLHGGLPGSVMSRLGKEGATGRLQSVVAASATDVRDSFASLLSTESVLRESVVFDRPTTPVHPPVASSTDLAPLDYPKIRVALLTCPASHVRRLLEALRSRVIVTAKDGEARRRVLHGFHVCDLLGLSPDTAAATLGDGNAGAGGPGSILRALFAHEDPAVRLALARLLNVLASYSIGRTYLLGASEACAEILCSVMAKETEDTSLRRQVLATLQKLTLRTKAQLMLIRLKVIPLVADILRYPDFNTKVTIKYGMALLMNLCLRQAGQIACEDPQVEILAVLQEYLESTDAQVRAYVNGTLYSVLQRPAIREKAWQMGLESILSLIGKKSEPTFARQIRYILQLLKSTNLPPSIPPEDPGLHDDSADLVDDSSNQYYGDDDSEDDPVDVEEQQQLVDQLGKTAAFGQSIRQGEVLLEEYRADKVAARQEFMRVSVSVQDMGLGQGEAARSPPDTALPSSSEDKEAAAPSMESLLQRPVTPQIKVGSQRLPGGAATERPPSSSSSQVLKLDRAGSARSRPGSSSISATSRLPSASSASASGSPRGVPAIKRAQSAGRREGSLVSSPERKADRPATSRPSPSREGRS